MTGTPRTVQNTGRFFIDGKWVSPLGTDTLDVINPATEQPIATIAMGGPADVDVAVAAARAAFATYSLFSVEERLDLLERVRGALRTRLGGFGEAITHGAWPGRCSPRWGSTTSPRLWRS